MRKNEYNNLEEFTNQYIGVWGPSDNHWLGLDFIYNEIEYRFQTFPMYKKESFLPDGREALFGLYKKLDETTSNGHEYKLLGEYATMNEVLDSKVICGIPFRTIIMDDNTELVGQD